MKKKRRRQEGKQNVFFLILRMVVYIDVLFLVNFTMNMIVLSLTGKIIRKSNRFLWKLAAGAIGSVLYCGSLFFPFLGRPWISFLYGILVSMVMAYIAYHPKIGRELVKGTIALHIIAFFLAGAIQGLYSYTTLGFYIRKWLNGEINVPIDIKVFSILTILSYIVLRFSISWYRNKDTKNKYYTIVLGKKDKRVTAKALMDTGNSLRDPISQKPVMVINLELIQDLYDKEKESEVIGFYEKKNTETEGMILIPYHTVGEDGVMIGFNLDFAVISDGEDCIRIKKPCAAVSPKPVNIKKQFQVLLQPEFFQV